MDWAKHFHECDILIHLADVVAGIGYVSRNESYIFRTNLLINSNVTKAIFESKPTRPKIKQVLKDGSEKSNVKILKFTLQSDISSLSKKYSSLEDFQSLSLLT